MESICQACCRSLWVMHDPELKTWQEGLPLDINKTLKRRYFLVEKAKNADVIGTHSPLLPSLHAMTCRNTVQNASDHGKHNVIVHAKWMQMEVSKQWKVRSRMMEVRSLRRCHVAGTDAAPATAGTPVSIIII